MNLYRLLRPIFFLPGGRLSEYVPNWPGLRILKDSETSHRAMIVAIYGLLHVPGFRRAIQKAFGWESPTLELSLWNRDFSNPLGVAAGFDKFARIFPSLLDLGFGHVEVGTVTPKPQFGQTRPRIYRDVKEEAVFNWMGFPSKGVDRLAKNLDKFWANRGGLVGVNLGKNLETPLERAAQDFIACMQVVYSRADYLVVNVSSPNTSGLRSLQTENQLSNLLNEVIGHRDQLSKSTRNHVPLLVKIAPDMNDDELGGVVSACLSARVDGVVATNTSTRWKGGEVEVSHRKGGQSGRPLFDKALRTISSVYRQSEGRLVVVGVGGVFSSSDAYRFFCAGASLVQIHTGLIYEGWNLARSIKQELTARIESEGHSSIQDIIGLDHRRQLEKSDKPSGVGSAKFSAPNEQSIRRAPELRRLN